MKDPKNVTIALLCVSATILATLAAIGSKPQPALADPSLRGGDYIMVTGAWSDTIDLLYVIDVAAQKMNVYAFNIGNNTFELFDQGNMKLLFRQQQP